MMNLASEAKFIKSCVAMVLILAFPWMWSTLDSIF